MIVACASANRAGRVLSFRQWPENWKERTFLCVPQSQREAYTADWPNLVCHPDIPRLSPTRDWINDHFYPEHVLHLDDDMRFFTRDLPDDLRPATPEELAADLQYYQDTMEEGIVYCGMWFRFMCQNREDISSFPPGMSGFFAVNTKFLRSIDFRFSQTELSQGLNLSVTLARMGYETRMTAKIVYEQAPNAPGGSSAYRTGELYDSLVPRFKELHGEEYIGKVTRWCNWPGMEGYRDFVKVYWQRIKRDIPQVKRYTE
jgi:hypothetical protein